MVLRDSRRFGKPRYCSCRAPPGITQSHLAQKAPGLCPRAFLGFSGSGCGSVQAAARCGTWPHTTPLNEQVTLSPLAETSVGGKSKVPFTRSPCGTADAKREAISLVCAWATCNWSFAWRSTVYCQEPRIRNSVSATWMACTFGPMSTHGVSARKRQRLR